MFDAVLAGSGTSVRWLHTHEGRKIFRYTMVSVISTAVSAIVIVLVYGVFHLWSEVPSTIFGNVVATFPSYWLNRRWAWGKRGRSHLVKEVLPFWIMAALGIAFSIVGAALARHIGMHFNLSHLEQTVRGPGGQLLVLRRLLGGQAPGLQPAVQGRAGGVRRAPDGRRVDERSGVH